MSIYIHHKREIPSAMKTRLILILFLWLWADVCHSQTTLLGDINGDGAVTISDVQLLVHIVLFGEEKKAYKECPDDQHPHLIDLGLASGTKWACCNVGANTPEDYGAYFAWGETREKANYSWDTYVHCDGTKNSCRDIGGCISGTRYDVATVKWGAAWQMPTFEQMQELLDNCTSQWVTSGDVTGRLFTGANGGKVFLPAAGYKNGDTLNLEGSYGDYWSGTSYPKSNTNSYMLSFLDISANWYYSRLRCNGFSVRPVKAP